MPAKDLTYQDIKTILAAAIGIKEWNIDDVSNGFVYYTQDVSTGLTSVRSTFKRAYTITEATTGTKVTLGDPVQVVKRTLYEPLVVTSEFSMDDAEVTFSDDGMVLRTGKVFEAGEYPDKNFSITEEELAQVPATFSPVSNDLEHKPTILSGKVGQLRSVVAKGKELYGTVAIPKWLNDTIGSNPLKVSLAWTRDSKRIVGNALVLNPRVPDAQLVAAFTAANSYGGGDMPITKTEKKPTWWEKLCAAFTAKQLPEGFEDFDPEQVKFANDADPEKPAETKPDDTSAPVVEPTKADDPAAAKFAADLDAERKVNAGLQARLIQSEAEKFANDAIKAGHAFPAERDSLIAQFSQAVKDDAQSASVACFSVDGSMHEGSRVKLLRDSVQARPKHSFTSEEIAGVDAGDLVVLSASPGGAQKMTPERRQELLNAGEIRVKEGK